MMFVLFLFSGALAQSVKDCDELGWSDEIKSGEGRYDGGIGIEGVCGTKESTICGKSLVKEDAEKECTDLGARLCTEAEYEALEAGNSGCNLEKKGRYAWTSSECDNGGGFMSIKLTEEGEVTKKCREAIEKAYGGRCCADAGGAPEPPLSEKTCAEMGWSDEVITGGLGVEGVCGTKGDESVCGGEMLYDAADTICTDMGVRLCTQEEYEALEAFNSGCKYEKKNRYLWTSTECTQDGGDKLSGYMSVKLSQTGSATSECTSFGEKAYGGRCCADVGDEPMVTDSPTMAPSLAPTTLAPTTVSPTMLPSMAPSVDPDAIDEIMAELMCIAASSSKAECKAALPVSVGKCKYTKGHNIEDRCKLKVFYGSCDSLGKKDCVKAVDKGRCEFDDEDAKTCKDKEE